MEKHLKCCLLFSLKEMALRKVAVLLWSSSDILSSKSKFGSYGYNSRNDWIETNEGKIKDKILKLELPESLIKQMIDIVRPIGLQIKRWMEFEKDEDLSNEYKEIMLPNSAKLCWTMAGVINYKKMAEELVRCDELPVFKRYEIACVYCLEDYIPFLWEELPEETKDYLYNKKLAHYNYSLATYFEFSWPHIFKGDVSKLNYLWRRHSNLTSFNQWAFEISVEKRFKAATEYFFHKLTLKERKASLKRTVKAMLRDRLRTESRFLSHFCDETLCFLLSVMTPKQQMKTIEAHPIPVLLCFLDWPRQDLFLEIAELIWTILPPSCYADLLWTMAGRLHRADHYFPKLFQEFFMQSPQGFKTYCVRKDSRYDASPAGRLLRMFFEFDDSESIKVIFRNVDAEDRARLVFDHFIIFLFYEFILKENFHLVALCLREAGLSKEETERLNERLIYFVQNLEVNFELEKPKFKRFFEFLDETDMCSNKKRKVLEG